jgi:hypothetical protein
MEQQPETLLPPPIPSRLSRRQSRRGRTGQLLVSVGVLPWVRMRVEVTEQRVLQVGELSVPLDGAAVRLEEVVRPFHLAVVPKPGSLLVPSIRLEVPRGEPELRAAWWAALQGQPTIPAAEGADETGLPFETVWEAQQPEVTAFKLKKRWFSKGRSLKIKRADDDVTAFELVGTKKMFKSVVLSSPAAGELLFAKV